MKIKLFQLQRLHIYIALGLMTTPLQTAELPEQLEKTATPREMTPDQLAASLHLDKQDLDLDNMLEPQQQLNIEIDSLESADADTRSKPELNVPTEIQPLQAQRETRAKIKFPVDDSDERIEFQFEDADLQNLLTQISELYQVNFITDDSISPLSKTGKSIKGNKISFKTNRPLTKTKAWDLFLSFLDIAELALVPEADPHILRVISTTAAKTSPLPTYIGVRPDTLPDNDQLIRYLYFIENTSLDTINAIIGALKSPSAGFIILKDLNAFVLTDKSYNIKSLMNIITELDKVSLPQAMSVLKLKRANAEDVKKLYDSITQADDTSITARLFPARKQPSALYFPENTRIIAEPRTNSLILLGPLEAIKKIEEFIIKNIDIELGEETLSPLRVYTLKYADCVTVADIMNNVTQFGKATTAGKVGGVRDGDKYIKSLVFIAEPATNRLVIKGEEEDWLQAKEMIEKLDEPQPQVAIEALILTIRLSERKSLGTQMRSKVPGINGLVGNGVKFQTSGITFGGAPNSFALNTASTATGAQRLLGNLITLATGAGPGNTVVTLGIDTFGVWGIFNALQTIVNTQVISNPFLTATNKQEAVISIGELRRVISGTVISGTTPTNSFANDAANLSLRVRPQINSDGMIVLDLDININEFTDPTAPSSGTKITRQVKTSTIVADKEVIAVGGLIRNEADSSLSKVPILGNIPIIGWLFKNKTKNQIKNNLLILISTRILKPGEAQGISSMTQDRITDYHGTLDEMQEVADKRDPIHRAFFADKENSSDRIIDDFIFDRRHEHDSQKKKKKTSKKNRSSTVPATATRALQLTAQQPAVPKPPLRKPGSAPAHLPPTKAQQSKSTEQKTGKKSIVDLLSQDEGRAPHD